MTESVSVSTAIRLTEMVVSSKVLTYDRDELAKQGTDDLHPVKFMVKTYSLLREKVPEARYYSIALGYDVYHHLTLEEDSEFYSLLDPVARHERILQGELGTVWGASVYTPAVCPALRSAVPDNVIAVGAYDEQGNLLRSASVHLER